MPSPESEDETRPASEPPTAGPDKADEPAWPPAEAQPEESSPPSPAAAPSPAEPAPAIAAAAAIAEPLLTKAEELPPAKNAEPAAEPSQEMGLSESTLHWLVDSERAIEPVANDPATGPHYDPRAPVAGRKRAVALIGGAAIVALVVAGVLHGQAARNRAAADVPPVGLPEPAAVLTQRAEAALAQGRSDEALDLAHLALESNPRFSDGYMVVGKVERDIGRLPESRDAYRKYLELAPLGTHAEEARAALATLPP